MPKRILFIDRDGVLIREPSEDFQIDSLDKLEFVPGVFRSLAEIREKSGYWFAMVTNQDGLGTESFPEESFLPPHELLMRTLAGEGIHFDAVHIDPSFPEDRSPNRKPGTGMLQSYVSPEFDLEHSLVIGDRLSDLELAKNLSCRAIWFVPAARKSELESGRAAELRLKDICIAVTDDWREIANILLGGASGILPSRKAQIRRKTEETDVSIDLNLDGGGEGAADTGLKFFDHMLNQLPRHGGFDLSIQAAGDLEVDEHHTIEDTGLALGEAFRKALGDKRGVQRYGFLLPMDESLAQAAVDFSGRPWLVWEVDFSREYVGDTPTEMFMHFFKSFSDAAGCNLHIKAAGENQHHLAEAVFKAFARAVGMAVKRNPLDFSLPSTKGAL